jgi:hypothetical protein
MAISSLPANDMLKLKSDFRRALEKCPSIGGKCPAGALRGLLRDEGWQNVIKTNDDIAELAQLCGVDVDAYPTGGRSGKTIGLYVSDPRKAKTGKPIEARGEVHRQVHRLFGFPLGTKKNAAAALYLSDAGATTEEIRKEIGEPMLNLLKEVKIQGHAVSEIKEKSPSGRSVKRYKIIPRDGFP